MIFNLRQYSCNLQNIFTNYAPFKKKKNNGNKNNKTLVKRKEDVGTPKFCKQGGEANIGPEIKQTTSV